MKRAYLLGYPVGHSLSPAMHNAAFAALGLSARYEALEQSPEQLEQIINHLRRRDCYGANVTTPHKLAVLPYLDELSDAARAIGAVNTIINRKGRLFGDNTDAGGFIRALSEQFGSPVDKRALILGAGGAARAVLYALLNAGASVKLYNRTEEKARQLGRDFKDFGKVTILSFEDLDKAVRGAELLVNTTKVGMAQEGEDPDASPLPPGLLPYEGRVADIIYRPAQTRLLKDAQAAGLETQNGLPMLVYQGAASFEAWTGQSAPTSLMMAAARDGLERPQARAYPKAFEEGQA